MGKQADVSYQVEGTLPSALTKETLLVLMFYTLFVCVCVLFS